MKRLLLTISAVAFALPASPLSGATMIAQVGPPVGSSTGGPCTVFSPNQQTEDGLAESRLACGGARGASAAIAVADFGVVRTESQSVSNFGVRTDSSFVLMGARASFFEDELRIAPVEGEAELGQLVPLRPQLSFSGLMMIDLGVEPFSDPRAFFSLRYQIFNQSFSHQQSLPGTSEGNLPFPVPLLVSEDGQSDTLFYGLGISDVFIGPEILVPVGVPIIYSFTMEVGTAAVGQQARAEANFGNSLEVPFGVDAFILPAGYTANAGNWLVNNRRVDLNAPAVPEPSTWAMLIAGFGMIGAALRRRKPKRPVYARSAA